MNIQPESLSREERAALRRLRELLKEQQRAQAAAKVSSTPTPQNKESSPRP